jgi:hypothetical protein
VSTHEFVLALPGVAKITRKIEDALFRAGCDDATLYQREGKVFLAFAREAEDRPGAIVSALEDVGKAGLPARIVI